MIRARKITVPPARRPRGTPDVAKERRKDAKWKGKERRERRMERGVTGPVEA